MISERDYRRAIDDLETAKLNYDHASANAGLDRDSLWRSSSKTKRLALDRQKLLVEDLARQVDELKVRSPVEARSASSSCSSARTSPRTRRS